MTIDAEAALEVAADAAGRQNPLTTFSDLRLLYGLLQAEKAGKLTLTSIVTGGQLKADIAALARESALLNALLNDPVEGPKTEALLHSLI